MRAILNNWPWKLFSFGLAVLLWHYTASDEIVLISMNAPVQYRALPAGMEVSSEIPATVRVELSGPSRRLNPSLLERVHVVLDLSGQRQSGREIYTVSNANLTVPAGVTFVRSIPSQIAVSAEKRVSRDLKVVPDLNGRLPDGFVLRSARVEPATLRVVGPQSFVDRVEDASTAPIDLTNLRGVQKVQVYSIIDEPQVRFDGASKVTVHLQIDPK